MTGRELIIYILENNLEDKNVFEDGKILGFMTVSEAALKFNVGIETINILIRVNKIPYIRIGEGFYIPCNAKIFGDEQK